MGESNREWEARERLVQKYVEQQKAAESRLRAKAEREAHAARLQEQRDAIAARRASESDTTQRRRDYSREFMRQRRAGQAEAAAASDDPAEAERARRAARSAAYPLLAEAGASEWRLTDVSARHPEALPDGIPPPPTSAPTHSERGPLFGDVFSGGPFFGILFERSDDE